MSPQETAVVPNLSVKENLELICGGVLYVSYLATYLVNCWLEQGITPILVFTGIFVLGYLIIWGIIYSIIRKKTDKLNEGLKKRQQYK